MDEFKSYLLYRNHALDDVKINRFPGHNEREFLNPPKPGILDFPKNFYRNYIAK